MKKEYRIYLRNKRLDIHKSIIIEAWNFNDAYVKAKQEVKWWDKQKLGKHELMGIMENKNAY